MRFGFVVAAAAMMLGTSASATLIQGQNSLPGATAINLPAVNYNGAGPQTVGPITWTSGSPASLFGWTGTYNFGTNGSWDNTPLIGLNNGADPISGGYSTMTITFANPVSGFLAELNWRLGTTAGNSTIMLARDVNGNVLTHSEWAPNTDRHYYWPLSNNGNFNVVNPGYFGFTFANPVIKSVEFSNGHVAARNMSFIGPGGGGGGGGGGGTVPEPASWAMLIAGFGLVGAMQRRHRPVRVAA